MLGLATGIVETIGRGPAAALLALGALAVALAPVAVWRARGRWRRAEARVEAVAPRRSLATGAWTVEVAYEAEGAERRAALPVNLVRRPLSPGDRVTVLVDPARPERAVLTRWQGASTPLMIAPLLALAAAAIARG